MPTTDTFTPTNISVYLDPQNTELLRALAAAAAAQYTEFQGPNTGKAQPSSPMPATDAADTQTATTNNSPVVDSVFTANYTSSPVANKISFAAATLPNNSPDTSSLQSYTDIGIQNANGVSPINNGSILNPSIPFPTNNIGFNNLTADTSNLPQTSDAFTTQATDSYTGILAYAGAPNAQGSSNIRGDAREFAGRVPYFLYNVLSQPAGALPKGAQWVVMWAGNSNHTKGLPNTIRNIPLYEPNGGTPWAIENAFLSLATESYNGNMGCMFAQSINIPGEDNNVQPDGIVQMNGYLQGYIGQGRQIPNKMSISFLETNVDFVDNIIRPWVIMTGHLGMINRPAEQEYRTDILFYKLGITTPFYPPTILAKYSFYNACPVSVTAHEYTYDPYTAPIRKTAEFVYQYYSVNSSRSAFVNA